ncbi:MAG: 16S rRNA (adenine(1518)-N(6)/adenine(1519)-N(6))-dimethyltransferase RsmA [Brevefilum sp.]
MALKPLHIPEILKQYNLRPQKFLGQNFLADHNALQKIVEDSGVGPEDRVLEIGAGLGSLTRLLAERAGSVVAVEIDPHLFPALQSVTRKFDNVRLIQGDILEMAPREIFDEDGYQVVANIPYYITSAVVRHLLEAEVRPARLVLTMQREVAERILNEDEKMSLLSLSVQVYGEAYIASHIPAECFYPRPKVDSSVLVIDVDEDPKFDKTETDRLFSLAHIAFNQKRKMLRSSLRPTLGQDLESVSEVLQQAGINPCQRPETLSLEDWIRLVEVVE